MNNKYQFKLNPNEVNDSHMGLARRIQPGERILELGCSSGYLSRFLQQDLGCYVVGVDIDRSALQQAAEFCAKAIVADLDQDDWLREIAGERFDTILCADVLEHLKNPAALLAKLKPYLAEKGRVLASIPNVAHASIRLELLQGHFDYECLGILDDTHLHFYTLNGCMTLFMQAGFLCRDVAYSIHDLADEVIDSSLAKVGLTATAEYRSILHTADATAFQFIIEAIPAAPELLQNKPAALTPKPLVSSGAFYSLKQEEIETLERRVRELENAKIALETHNTSLIKDIEVLKTHNQNHQHNIDAWMTTGRVLDGALFDLTMRNENVAAENAQLTFKLSQEQAGSKQLNAKAQHLEAVLHRVHSKLSYRMVRFVKELPRKLFKALGAHKNISHNAGDVSSGSPASNNFHDYNAWLVMYGDRAEKLPIYTQDCQSWVGAPKIAILMPVFNPTRKCLQEAIESVLQQVYPHWELCVADDASTEAFVQEVLQFYAAEDQRIKVMRRGENGNISQASNSALDLVNADFVALMDHDDLLTPDALYWVAKTIKTHPDVQLIYSDEDKLTEQGQRYGAYFKPDWNPELLLSHNYVCHLGVYRADKVRKLGGFDPAFDGAQDYDLTLRYVAELKSHEIQHIPRILYHWRATPGSTANGIHEKPYAEPLIRKTVQQALQAKGVQADVLAHAHLPGALRVRYALPRNLPLVSIVIPTRNGFTLLKRCVDSILNATDYNNIELIIIDNGSDDWIAQRYLESLQADARITILYDDSSFNFAALNNKAVKLAQGEILALLNNDLEVINSDWLNEMVSIALHPGVGAVGAKLYYPNDTIQHAGVIVGLGGVAGHSHKHFPRESPGYCGRLQLTQNLSAVTAACLVVRKTIFDQVGGFDERHLKVAFNDVDLCLRIQEAGFRNVWTPYAELYHYESATRGYEDTSEKQARFSAEIQYMKQRWGESLRIDPAYNPNLTLDREDFSFAFPPRV